MTPQFIFRGSSSHRQGRDLPTCSSLPSWGAGRGRRAEMATSLRQQPTEQMPAPGTCAGTGVRVFFLGLGGEAVCVLDGGAGLGRSRRWRVGWWRSDRPESDETRPAGSGWSMQQAFAGSSGGNQLHEVIYKFSCGPTPESAPGGVNTFSRRHINLRTTALFIVRCAGFPRGKCCAARRSKKVPLAPRLAATVASPLRPATSYQAAGAGECS